MTTRENSDQRHPQRYVNVPPPDGLTYRPGPPALHAIGARVDLSWVMASDTSYDQTDGTVMQAFEVLRRQPAPRLFAHLNTGAISLIAVVVDDMAATLLATASLSATVRLTRKAEASLATTATLTAALTVVGLEGQWDFTDVRHSGQILTSGI